MCVAVDRCASNYTHTHHQQHSRDAGNRGRGPAFAYPGTQFIFAKAAAELMLGHQDFKAARAVSQEKWLPFPWSRQN